MRPISFIRKLHPLRIILVLSSAVIATVFPSVSQQEAKVSEDRYGNLTMLTNGDWTCTWTEGARECVASDCKAPGISTECYDKENDHQTTVNELKSL